MIFKRLKKSTKEEEEQFGKMFEEEKVGWKDKFAMIFSAFFVIVLPCIVILVLLALFMLWIVGAL